MKLLTFLTLLGAITLIYATSSDSVVSESRKNVRQSGSPSPLNSLASNQDGPAKQQQSQQQVQQSYKAQQEYPNPSQSHSTLYNHIQSGSAPSPTPQNGYIISVNQNGQQGAGATPVLMQYLPQNQQSGGIQYLQLIPTRPLIVPISPYITQLPQYNGQSTAQPTPSQYASASPTYGSQQFNGQSTAQPTPSQYASASPTYGSQQFNGQSTAQPTPSQYASQAAHGSHQLTYGQQSSPTHSYLSYQNPIGGYSSPVVSYFRPHSGIQLVDGPIDMSLNTNEYIPIQSESAFKMRRA